MAVRIRWNRSAFEAIRRGPKIDQELKHQADNIAKKANSSAIDSAKGGYIAVTGHGKTRDRAAVLTGTQAAKEDNAKNHTLLKALGSG